MRHAVRPTCTHTTQTYLPDEDAKRPPVHRACLADAVDNFWADVFLRPVLVAIKSNQGVQNNSLAKTHQQADFMVSRSVHQGRPTMREARARTAGVRSNQHKSRNKRTRQRSWSGMAGLAPSAQCPG